MHADSYRPPGAETLPLGEGLHVVVPNGTASAANVFFGAASWCWANGEPVRPDAPPPRRAAAAHLCFLSLPAPGSYTASLEDWQAELIRLADDPSETVAAAPAIECLTQYSKGIGQADGGDASAPLAAAVQRHADTEQAFRAARATRTHTRDDMLRRLELLDELDRLRARQDHLRGELERGTLAVRARLLADAETLHEQLDTATQRCFALSSVREFPLEQETAVKRAERRALEAREAHDTACAELAAVQERLAAEQARLDEEGGAWLRPLEEEWEERLSASDTAVGEAQRRLDAATTARDEVRQRLEDAERALLHLPDFGAFAGDPMEWMKQITTTFTTQARVRNTERKRRDELRKALAAREEALAGPRQLFLEGEDGILARARALDAGGTEASVEAANLADEQSALQSYSKEVEASIPGFRGMAALMAIATPTLILITLATRNPGLIYALSGVALALAFFAFSYFRAKRTVTRIRLRLNQIVPDAAKATAKAEQCAADLATTLADAKAGTLRELEAMYERYTEDRTAAETLARELATQEAKATAEEEHATALFANLQETFRKVGHDIVAEADVDEAVQRALSTYQQYRDAKRRRADSRDLLQRREHEFANAEAALTALTEEDVRLSLLARQHLRRAGFDDERKHPGALQALRAYRLRHAQQRTRSSRIELMEERRRILTQRAETTRQAHDEAHQTLQRLLSKAGVDSVEAWFARADEARDYRDAWTERTRRQEELDTLLAGETLEGLREELASVDDPAAFDRSPETVQSELEAVSDELDAVLTEAETLNKRLTQSPGDRTLNELEEDEAAARETVVLLTAERRAASFAAATLQEITRTRQAAFAKRLAPLVTQWLQRLTGSTETTFALTPTLSPRVEGPPVSLGILALALRLAQIEALENPGEPLPLVVDGALDLDSPDEYHAMLSTLAAAAAHRQIIWCAGPAAWADAARARDLPVLELHAAPADASP